MEEQKRKGRPRKKDNPLRSYWRSRKRHNKERSDIDRLCEPSEYKFHLKE